MSTNSYLGVDVGTQGVRVIAVNDQGDVLAACKHSFPLGASREEQSADMWWSVLVLCLQSLVKDLSKKISLAQITAISVTSTSGTVIPLNRRYEPIHNALMYSDTRSVIEAEWCQKAASKETAEGEISFHSSYGLPKMVWFMRNYPQESEQIYLWSHAGDFLLGKLSGIWGVTDYSNSLKTGYDLNLEQWPDYLTEGLGIPSGWLPMVVKPGEVLGAITPDVAEATGLPKTVRVVTGMTDGCTSQIAAGSIKPGDWNTTIGTTLVIKGVTHRRILDPLGRIYNHKHPQGYWMPGGASNTGADWISKDYEGYDLDRLNQSVDKIIPSPWISYPLLQKGERFPFYSLQARGFHPCGLTPEQLYASRLEGVAFVERLAYELIEKMSGERVETVCTAGGGSLSDVWLKIRSNVLQKPIMKMKTVEGAAGAAVIAASQTGFGNLEEAARQMIHLEKTVEPGELAAAYEEKYLQFVDSLIERGYLQE